MGRLNITTLTIADKKFIKYYTLSNGLNVYIGSSEECTDIFKLIQFMYGDEGDGSIYDSDYDFIGTDFIGRKVHNNSIADKLSELSANDKKNIDIKVGSLRFDLVSHLFVASRGRIASKESPIYSDDPDAAIVDIFTLRYLITGDNEQNMQAITPDIMRNDAVLKYLEEKRNSLVSNGTSGNVNIEQVIKSTIKDIETTDKAITKAMEQSRKMLKKIYSLSGELEESLFLQDRFKALATQYETDIDRLNFIIDGVEDPHDETYIAAKAEFDRISALYTGLRSTQSDNDSKIASLKQKLGKLNSRNDEITKLISSKFKPQTDKLSSAVVAYMEQCGDKALLKMLDSDIAEYKEKTEPLNQAKNSIDKDVWDKFNRIFASVVKACGVSFKDKAYISLKTLDAVVDGVDKSSMETADRIFFNIAVRFSLLKLLEAKGTYSAGIMLLESPYSEAVNCYNDTCITNPDMLDSLLRYISKHCGRNQVIITDPALSDNNIPAGAKIIKINQSIAIS